MHTFDKRHQLGTLLFVRVSFMPNMVHIDLCMCHSQGKGHHKRLKHILKKRCCLRIRKTLATLFCAFTKHVCFSINKALSAQQNSTYLAKTKTGCAKRIYIKYITRYIQILKIHNKTHAHLYIPFCSIIWRRWLSTTAFSRWSPPPSKAGCHETGT